MLLSAIHHLIIIFGSSCSPDTDLEDKLYSLPSYLEALANIVKEVDYVSMI